MLCFSICNRFISLKRQHVRPMRDQFERARREHDEFQAAARAHAGPQPLVYQFLADFRTITPVKAPTEVLERLLFERISIRGRALAAAVDLVGAIDGLDKSIIYRNDLIAEIQKEAPHAPAALAAKYFGLPTEEAVIDNKYPASVEAIHTQTDDCIFFSRVLADDLLEYGTKLRRRHVWRFRISLPKLGKADWSMAEDEGLLPQMEQYETWLRGFQKRPTLFRRLTDWVSSFWHRRA